MKLSEKIISAFFCAAFLLAVSSCKNSPSENPEPDEPDFPEPEVTLPDSKGENIFSGKKFTEEYSFINVYHEWDFTDSKVTVTKRDDENEVMLLTSYSYSFDTEKSLLYLVVESYKDAHYISFSSFSEYLEKMTEKEIPSKMRSVLTASTYFKLSTVQIYNYVIAENRIALIPYFNGKLPSNVTFCDAENTITLSNGVLTLKNETQSYVLFSDEMLAGEESGTFFAEGAVRTNANSFYEECGKVSGTFKSAGSGTAGCSVTLTFTELPSSITFVQKEKSYVLTQKQVDGLDIVNRY